MSQDFIHECAVHLLETLPRVMRMIGGEMHQRGENTVTGPQFHALVILQHHQNSSLSSIAQHLGASNSATSKLVNGLVARGLVRREMASTDRRGIMLTLSTLGQSVVEGFRADATEYISEVLADITADEAETLMKSLYMLRSAFTREQEHHAR